MIEARAEAAQHLLDRMARGTLGRRDFLKLTAAMGVAALLGPEQTEQAWAAGQTQLANRQTLKDSYDYVVVGAGAAGCIVAARLADAGAEVLLVESGGSDDLPQVTTPGLWFTNIGGPLDWKFRAAPSRDVNGRAVPIAMGRVLGGGTSINAMLWVRGLAQDYDDWARQGGDGWGFSDVLPVFREIEDWEGGANAWRGAGGPLHIRTAHTPHPSAPAFIEAARQMDIPILDDMNGPMRTGAGYVNMSINRDGSRASAARAFLRPALGHANLTLLLDTDAVRLLFTGSRCTGIALHGADGIRSVAARREIIVTAGGIASAKLLLQSGIGDADDARRLGIAPIVNLKGVGHNFQDHPLLFGVTLRYKGKFPPRSMTSDAVEAAALVHSDAGVRSPDVMMVLQQVSVVTPEIRAAFGAPPENGFVISPALVRPTSRGRYQLTSADWRQPGRLDAGFLSTRHDLDATVRCIDLCRDLARQHGFDSVREAEVIPGRSLDQAALRDFARNATISFGHPVGTCKMGTDDMAVVDSTLRVHGVEGLRVCDSSIMPSIVTGPTSAASHMIGAKAAQMILGTA
ncbi:GMC family oxidoreductase [Burkholderia guangdongensis]|uniref:GMC family oxidoreductase n=1 Tax=Burkholderia guangdongensis TaxID=1792500 RepID=UPI0015CE4EFA|nr:GMC family oxidoreductase N-terminal domain-containing protein [Burkholderia guangdongensis]